VVGGGPNTFKVSNLGIGRCMVRKALVDLRLDLATIEDTLISSVVAGGWWIKAVQFVNRYGLWMS